MQHFDEGIDPTANTNPVTKADLLQLIRSAKPTDGQGIIIWSQTAPDVIANPELAWFLWGELDGSDEKTGVFYYYETASWQVLPLSDGNLLANGSVPLSKLTTTGVSALDIIQRNAANNAFVFVSVVNAIQNNSVPVSKLLGASNADNFVLMSLLGVRAWTTIEDLIGAIQPEAIPLSAIELGAANTFLRVNSTATALEYTTADIQDLLAQGWNAGEVARRNAGNTGWEPFTPSEGITITELTNSGAYYALPANGANIEIAHGLGQKPQICRVVFICTSAHSAYLVGDELEIFSVCVDLDGTNQFNYAVTCDTSKIYVSDVGITGGGSRQVADRVGAAITFDTTKWKIKAYVA
jgi:hypothetical protein